MSEMTKTILLIDAFSIAYRAFYSYPPNLKLDDDTPINAVYGFISLILKSIDLFDPDYVCVCFDRKEPTFRHQRYTEYKAHRPPPPDEFVAQIPYFRKILDQMGICWLDCVGYEADDIIGTLASKASESNLKTMIMTGDQDALQLVNESVSVVMNKKGLSEFITYTPEKIVEKFQLSPLQIIDYKALKGDSSDNIPGVKGVGDKTATKLLLDYHNLEGIYQHLDEVASKSVRTKLETDKDNAFLSLELATINVEVPVSLDFEGMCFRPNWANAITVFQDYKFLSLVSKYRDKVRVPIDEKTDTSESNVIELPVKGMYQLVESLDLFETLIPILKNGFAIDLETTSLAIADAQIVGIALAMSPRKGYYIPLNEFVKDLSNQSLPMFQQPSNNAELFSASPFLDRLKPLLEDASIPKYTHNGKYEIQVLRNYGICLKGIKFDSLIAAYLLYPGERLGLKSLVETHFGFEMTTFESLVGKKSEWQTFLDVPVEKAVQYAAADADFTLRLKDLFQTKIDAEYKDLFYGMELPLQAVLAQMEYEGVTIDAPFLHELNHEFLQQITSLEQSIYDETGEQFNIKSTKQLATVLFEKMGLPIIKKTKTGASTDSSVLAKLEPDFPIVKKILDYRHYSKLISTYVQSLPELIHSRTHKVHTNFNQTVTATGRLSSSNPNLQNIPIRTPSGIQIRKAFIPTQKNGFIMSADYSQIELRVLAHMAGDAHMIEAFSKGEDIHQSTAALVFDVPYDNVTKEQRSQAKTVNFGITYGQSAFALSEQLGIDRKQAQGIIDTYYEKFSSIRKFIDDTVNFAIQHGYVETAFGRRRSVQDIGSQNRNAQNAAQRIAVNTRVQGTAADIIKMAMINVQKALVIEGLQSKMVIQVHDELLLDGRDGEQGHLETLIRKEMESVVSFDVPLLVDVAIAKNWMACEG